MHVPALVVHALTSTIAISTVVAVPLPTHSENSVDGIFAKCRAESIEKRAVGWGYRAGALAIATFASAATFGLFKDVFAKIFRLPPESKTKHPSRSIAAESDTQRMVFTKEEQSRLSEQLTEGLTNSLKYNDVNWSDYALFGIDPERMENLRYMMRNDELAFRTTAKEFIGEQLSTVTVSDYHVATCLLSALDHEVDGANHYDVAQRKRSLNLKNILKIAGSEIKSSVIGGVLLMMVFGIGNMLQTITAQGAQSPKSKTERRSLVTSEREIETHERRFLGKILTGLKSAGVVSQTGKFVVGSLGLAAAYSLIIKLTTGTPLEPLFPRILKRHLRDDGSVYMVDHPKRELGKTEHHQAAEVIHKRFLGGLLMLPVMFLAGSGGDSFYKKMKGVVTGPSSKVSVKKVPRSLQDLD